MAVKIEINGGDAKEALTELAGLSSGLLSQLAPRSRAILDPDPDPAPGEPAMNAPAAPDPAPAPGEPAMNAPAAPEAESGPRSTTAVAIDTRQVNQPREGKSRRSSDEKADDDRLIERANANGVSLEQVNAMILEVGRARVEQELVAMELPTRDNISTGGPRVNPEDEAQDAEDETAEADAKRDPDAPVTQDDLKAAMTAYVTKFGLDAAQSDGKAIFEDALGKPPGGTPGWRMSLVAEQGQRALAKATDAWNVAAAADTRYGAAFDG